MGCMLRAVGPVALAALVYGSDLRPHAGQRVIRALRGLLPRPAVDDCRVSSDVYAWLLAAAGKPRVLLKPTLTSCSWLLARDIGFRSCPSNIICRESPNG